jgi:WD40 repeat protein
LIIIYDLRTATKWRILEGHFGDITAIAFSDDGSMLASYSGDENPPSLRVWRAGGQGILSGLLGLQGKCLRTFHLKQLESEGISKTRLLKNTSLVWTSANSLQLTREDRSGGQFTL